MAESSTTPPSLSRFDDYNANLQGAALKATRNAVFLPADLNFYRSLDRGLAKEVDICSSRVLSLANRLLDLVSTGDNSVSKSKGKAVLDHDDVMDNFRSSVVDPMDQLLERADSCLDDFLGLRKAPAIAINPKQSKPKAASKPSTAGRLDPALQHASHLPRPQLLFKRKVDNNGSTPWRPNLRHKFNAQVPLGQDLHTTEDVDMTVTSPPHPYRYEIKNISYPARMFAYAEPIPPKSVESTPFQWVATPAELLAMLEALRAAKEIAIDLEYHSYRSFTGFVCLMQISTREGDWIVDTLAVRDELEELNEVFTDPKIVKVLHGAESDIIWLQQDFNLYIVNLFDTYHASKVLDFPRHGLATLMEMYCDIIPDKRYQLADWRIRPLPDEMLQYARSDTHFLLFIYDNLRNALIDRAQSRAQSPSNIAETSQAGRSSVDPSHAFVREVLSRSEETALRAYEKEVYDHENGAGPGGWDTLARKWNKGAFMASERDSSRRRVYRAVHAWRDRVSREEDESTRYVLPNHQLFLLAEQPPTDMAGLLSKFQHVPAIVRRRIKELLDIIVEAVKEPVSAAQNEGTDHSPSTDVTMLEEVTTKLPSETAEPPHADLTAHLWPTGDVATLLKPTSTLLGASANVPKKTINHNVYVTSQSSLFPSKVLSRSTTLSNRSRVHEVVARIHGALVVAPSLPQPLPPVPGATSAEQAETEEGAETLTNQVEIPFVPLGQRQDSKDITAMDSVRDSIVVVGQGQRKKRKREKKEKDSAGTSQAKSTSEAVSEEAAFDYSTVSNILDEGSDHEPDTITGARKRKQKTHGRFDYGDFRAPPKALSEMKSGNQSRTFK